MARFYEDIKVMGGTVSIGTLNPPIDGIFTVAGTYGVLFNVSDNKDGLLHSVNDISGLPILQVYSYDYVQMGKWDRNTLIVNSDKVGVGLTAPSTKLHVYSTQSGAFRLQDGSQANNYVLVSNASGVATWTSSVPNGVTGSGTVNRIAVFTSTNNIGNSYLIQGATGLSIDYGKNIYSITGSQNISINTNNRVLHDSNGSTSSDWGNRRLYYSNGVTSISWTGRLYDTSSNISSDWNTRSLNDSSGNTSLNWSDRSLYNISGTVSLNWDTYRLYDNNGVGVISVDWKNRYLRDTSSILSANWNNRNLYDNFGTTSSNWHSRVLFTSDYTLSVNWEERYLYDSANLLSISFENRDLLDSSGNTSLNWYTPGLVSVTGTVSTTNFQMTNGAANNYVLVSNASGVASWTSSISESNILEAQSGIVNQTNGHYIVEFTGNGTYSLMDITTTTVNLLRVFAATSSTVYLSPFGSDLIDDVNAPIVILPNRMMSIRKFSTSWRIGD